jgi:hypothetical protein
MFVSKIGIFSLSRNRHCLIPLQSADWDATITLLGIWFDYRRSIWWFLTPRHLSDCCHDNLKNMVITGFCSAKSMIKLTFHIMEKTKSLEWLTLDTTRGHDRRFPSIDRCWPLNEEIADCRGTWGESAHGCEPECYLTVQQVHMFIIDKRHLWHGWSLHVQSCNVFMNFVTPERNNSKRLSWLTS